MATLERIETGNDTVFRVPTTGHQFQLATWRGRPDIEPILYFQVAADLLAELALKTKEIAADPTLSAIGRARKLDPIQAAAIEAVARGWAGAELYATHLDRREAALLAVPQLHEQAAAVAIEDREMRDWWRSMPLKERAPLLKRIESEPGLQRLMIALLRAPAPLAALDHEIDIVRGVWAHARRLENPDEAAVLDEGRAAVEWAQRALAMLGAAARQIAAEWSADKVLRTLIASGNEVTQKGFGAFGFDPVQAAQMKLRIEAERKAA